MAVFDVIARFLPSRGEGDKRAAVAVDYAAAVTHPCCGNPGGGGFMLSPFTRNDACLNLSKR
jgi:gamma-glutamyltranspeptidase